MKRLQIFIIFIFIIIGLSAKGYTGQIAFVSNLVEEVNDSLHMSFKLNVRANAIGDCDAMYITPQLLSDKSIIEFPYILIVGNKKNHQIERWKSLNRKSINNDAPYMTVVAKESSDTLIDYNIKVPYEIWMDSACFVVKQEITDCRNDSRLFTFLLDNEIRLQPSEPYQVDALVSYIEPKAEVKVRQVEGKAYLDFHVGQSTILPNYRSNAEELLKINDAVSEVSKNPNVNITGLFIEGYASPEGSYKENDRLSYARAISLKNYMRDHFYLSENLFKVSNIAEDWDGLKSLLVRSNIPDQDRIVEIIDNTDIFDGREVKLMKLSGGIPYKKMLRELFPLLRRVEYRINFSVRDFTIAEAKSLLGKKDLELSQLEFYLLAFNYGKDQKEFADILTEKILKYYPDDEVANNNAAAVMISKGDLSLAKKNLSKAGAIPSALNNQGVILLKEGELDAAEQMFREALAGGVIEADHNLKELYIKRSDDIKMERFKRK